MRRKITVCRIAWCGEVAANYSEFPFGTKTKVIVTVGIGIPLEFVNESFPRPRRVNVRLSIDPDEQTDTCEREVGIHVSLDNHRIERGKSIITLGLRSVKLI